MRWEQGTTALVRPEQRPTPRMTSTRRIAGLLLPVALAGCATYAPLPLPNDTATPDLAALATQASAIRRPWLRPVTIDLAQPLDGNAIATLAVLANPDLKAARTRAGISEAQAFAARLVPDPTLTFGVSPILRGPDPLIDLIGSLGFDLASLRSRGIRLAQTRSAARQVRLDLAWTEWQVAGQARLRAVRIPALERAAMLAEASRASARSLLDRTRRAAGRGDLSGDPLQAARLSAAGADANARTATRDLAVARGELLALLGLPLDTALALAPPPADRPVPDPARLYTIALVNRADLGALQAGYAASEALVRKAVLDQFPTLGITLNVNRDTAGNLIVGPTVDFTLPLFNRNRGGIAIERATRATLRAEYAARLFQTRTEIAGASGGIAIARRQRDAVLRDLPAAQRYAAATRRAATRGDLPRSTADTAEQALRDQQTLLVQSEQAIGEQLIALELLTGTPREAWSL